MKTFRFILSVFILLSFPLQNFAQDEAADDNTIKLYVGQVHMLAVKNPTRIVIGNPSIADVTDVKKTEVTIIPKRPGTTSFVLWDDVGEKSHKIIVMAEDMSDFKRRIDNLLAKLNLPQVHTQIAEEESKILLLGRVKSPQDREKIATVLGSLIDKTTDLIDVREEEAVIEIDVQILELNRDSTKTLGFTWPGAIALTDASGPVSNPVTGFKNVFHVSDFTRSAFSVTLDALVQEGKAKILSRPKLACQSGKEAELLVGGEKPIFTTTISSGGGSGTEVEYKEFGIKLKVKPTVSDDKKIKLALSVEVSEVGEAEFIGLTAERTAQAYPLTKRNASTELTLNDGQTMAIGGLIKQKTEEDVRKTAFLGDIPILGLMFRKTTTKSGGGQGERGDTELFIALTPTIVYSDTVEIKEMVALKLPHEETNLETAPNIPEHLANYIRVVQTKILDATYYPLEAQDAGWEGRVKLSLNINFNGDLKDLSILESSGYNILDDAAMEVARVQAPYPPFPPQIDSQEIWVDVPIVYKRN
ncbi:MAG: TonB family protein [Candidatus Omnitrophota bacterium]